MTMNLMLKKLYLDKKEFITEKELHNYAKRLKFNYTNIINYLLRKGYLIRIFRGIFYFKSIDETKLGNEHYSYMELVARGIALKGVKDWYFGLHSALKINNMTHEEFGIDEVISSEIFRAKPIRIEGHKFKFSKVSRKLLGFGIIEKGSLKYSDPEKTIMDFIYFWRYNGLPEERILIDLAEWAKGIKKETLRKYAKNYPKAVSNMIEKVLK
ncbi:MAG: hypothetical protein M1331_03510 [Candidatus Marsarchaeota archaeon]|nr:hypothetical protein [Candidatus Marsarchaeota archaeon]MCL5106434.1 hypothetical protein [Candidatus Marsarchaeota archaeon]